jgi:hypothetical protein
MYLVDVAVRGGQLVTCTSRCAHTARSQGNIAGSLHCRKLLVASADTTHAHTCVGTTDTCNSMRTRRTSLLLLLAFATIDRNHSSTLVLMHLPDG